MSIIKSGDVVKLYKQDDTFSEFSVVTVHDPSVFTLKCLDSENSEFKTCDTFTFTFTDLSISGWVQFSFGSCVVIELYEPTPKEEIRVDDLVLIDDPNICRNKFIGRVDHIWKMTGQYGIEFVGPVDPARPLPQVTKNITTSLGDKMSAKVEITFTPQKVTRYHSSGSKEDKFQGDVGSHVLVHYELPTSGDWEKHVVGGVVSESFPDYVVVKLDKRLRLKSRESRLSHQAGWELCIRRNSAMGLYPNNDITAEVVPKSKVLALRETKEIELQVEQLECVAEDLKLTQVKELLALALTFKAENEK